MRVNVDKVLERDQKLSELDQRAGKFTYSLHISFLYVVYLSVYQKALPW